MQAFGWPVVPEVNARRHTSIRRGTRIGESVGGFRSTAFEVAIAPGDDGADTASGRHIVEFRKKAVVRKRNGRLRLPNDGRQLRRAQHRHRRDCDGARFHDSQPGGIELGTVVAAQQHPVAGNDARVREDVRDAIRARQQFAVGDDPAVRQDRGPVAVALCDGIVQQHRRAIQPFGVAQFRQVEMQPRPQFLRREPVLRERVHVAILLKRGRWKLKGTVTFSVIEAANPKYRS